MLIVPSTIGAEFFDAGPAMTAGHLMRLMPAHPEFGFAAVPANGAVGFNAAWRNALHLLGGSAADRALVEWAFEITGDGPTRQQRAMTNRGGLLLLPSQVNALANTGAFFKAPAAIKQRILDRTVVGLPTLSAGFTEFALALVMRPIRAMNTSNITPSFMPLAGIMRPGGNLFSSIYAAGTLANNSAFPPSAIVAPTLRFVAAGGWTSSKPTLEQFDVLVGAGNSAAAGNTNAVYQNKAAGYVAYLADVIDLGAARIDTRQSGLSAPGASTYPLNYKPLIRDYLRWMELAFGAGGMFDGDNVPVDPAIFL
jgi:hypothetical protein